MQICFLFLATKLNTKKFLLTLQVTKNLFSISSLIFFFPPFHKTPKNLFTSEFILLLSLPHLLRHSPMERAVLLRSLPYTATISRTRFFSRTLHRLARGQSRVSHISSKRCRLLPNLHRSYLPLLCNPSSPSFNKHFSPVSVRAISTSAPESGYLIVIVSIQVFHTHTYN